MLNDITKQGAGFGADTNIVTYIDRQVREDLPFQQTEIADKIFTVRSKAKTMTDYCDVIVDILTSKTDKTFTYLCT